MTLTCEKAWAKQTYGPGIYINEVSIAEAEDISGTMLPFLQQPVDIGVKFKLEIGRDFQPEMVIAGSFKTDPETGEVIGWGSAFVVQEAFSRLGYDGSLDDGNKIPTSVLDTFIGKRFLRLSYVSGTRQDGRFRYTDWNLIATLEEGAHSLVKRFKKSLTRGYPKSYRPELLEASQLLTKEEESF